MDNKPVVGFIGLGIMGSAMASRLLHEGYHLHLWNRTSDKATALIEAGAHWSTSPGELAGLAQFIILMVTNDEAVLEITEGVGGVLDSLTPGATLINMSTISPSATMRLADKCSARSIAFIDAPVSGSKPQAESGDLIILAGGKTEDIEAATPLLLTMGTKIVRTGPVGSGTKLKLAVNLLLAHLDLALKESVDFCNTQSIAPELLLEVVESAPALKNGFLLLKGKKLLEQDWSPQFPLKHMLKDVRLVLETANASEPGAGFEITEKIERVMTEAVLRGHGDEDMIAVAHT